MENELQRLAKQHGTDKYLYLASIYWSYLKDLKHKPLRILEIGIKNGASLKMWRDFFPAAQIYGADLRPIEVSGVFCHCVDQSVPTDIRALAQKTGGRFDILIDDGGHRMSHQQDTFMELFPHVNPGGIYFVEDTHTSYMPSYQDRPQTMMAFLKSCLDHLTLRGSHLCDRGGYGRDPESPSYCKHEFDKIPFPLLEDVGTIHFYPRLAVITKKPGGLVPSCHGRGLDADERTTPQTFAQQRK